MARCIMSGGAVTQDDCCLSETAFPDTCGIGACACSPANSHTVTTCKCGGNECFDRTVGCKAVTPPVRDAAVDVNPACAMAATSEACVTCCKRPNYAYGGFELYGYDECMACPACSGFGPCGGNNSPPAGAACVDCLQKKIAMTGAPNCDRFNECDLFIACLKTCPIR
jgi:hypothetical protein